MTEEKDLARALRRHHAARLKQNRQFYWGRSSHDPLTSRQRGILLHTAHVCSCFGCGNPRRWFGEKSMQERRWLQETVFDALRAEQTDAQAGGCEDTSP